MLTTSALTLGIHTITAIYGGDAAYTDNSASLTQTVQPATAGISIMSSSNPSQPGQAVTVYVSVMSIGGNMPTGTVIFLDGTTTLGTAAVGGFGSANFTTSALSTGSHVITAFYSGDNTYAAVSTSIVPTVGLSSLSTPSVSVTSSANSSWIGQSVTFTATVSGGNAPTGSVTFLDGTTVLGTGAVDGNGNATFTTSSPSLGSHDIIAVYSGDSNNSPNAASLSQNVVQAASTTSLSSSANPSPVGQPVTFTIAVAAVGVGEPVPTGTVAIYDGTTFLGNAALSVVNGQVQATFTTSALGLGQHNIIAIYSGDSTFASSESSLEETISS